MNTSGGNLFKAVKHEEIKINRQRFKDESVHIALIIAGYSVFLFFSKIFKRTSSVNANKYFNYGLFC